MKKIGIDARLFFQTGNGVFIQNLLYYLQKIVKKNFYFYIYVMKEDFRKISFNKKNFIKKPISSPWYIFSNQKEFLEVLNRDNLDLMHFTHFIYPIAYNKKFIATIHDLTHQIFSKNINSLIFLYHQIKNSSVITVPTKTVKAQIIKLFGNKYKNKIIIAPYGINYRLKNAALEYSDYSPKIKKKLKKIFFIYVGDFHPHKNVIRLIKAFNKIKSEIQLVLIGPNSFFSKSVVNLVKELKLSHKIVFHFNASYKDLVFYYKNTAALVHPSLSEGFGLPLLEAAYFNCPIIASNINIFREIFDNKYISFNAKNINDIVDKINYFLRKKPKFQYKDIIKKFSFKKMAEEFFSLYTKLL